VSKNPVYIVLAIAFAASSSTACRTRMADDLDGYDCDSRTGVCTPAGGLLYIVSPSGTVYTNANVMVSVGFASGAVAPASVDILSDASSTPIASIGPPWVFTWDTTTVPEGTYQISARARFGSIVDASAPITVVVDRTPPTVLTRTPLPSATNVDLTLPVTVQLSEAALASTVTSSTVVLTAGTTVVPATSALSADGKTLTAKISSRDGIQLPATVKALLPSTITDLAGNALTSNEWSWTAPMWVQRGLVAGVQPSIAVDSKGRLLIATISGLGDMPQLNVARNADGMTWDTTLGSPQGPRGISTVTSPPTIALDASDDNPIIGWSEAQITKGMTAHSAVHFAKWNGSAWAEALGEIAPTADDKDGAAPTLVADGGQLWATWLETPGSYSTHVAKWNNGAWDRSYGSIDHDAVLPQLRVSSSGPVLSWWDPLTRLGGYSHWTGSAWATQTFPSASQVALAFDALHRALVTTADTSGYVTVMKYDAELDALTVPVPRVPVATLPGNIQLAVDDKGRVILAWTDAAGSLPQNVHVARYDGGSWDTSFGVLSALPENTTPAANVKLILMPDGSPVVAWDEGNTSYVWTSNH
jgi:hypothetical protein